jgi:hypothetical protein
MLLALIHPPDLRDQNELQRIERLVIVWRSFSSASECNGSQLIQFRP